MPQLMVLLNGFPDTDARPNPKTFKRLLVDDLWLLRHKGVRVTDASKLVGDPNRKVVIFAETLLIISDTRCGRLPPRASACRIMVTCG